MRFKHNTQQWSVILISCLALALSSTAIGNVIYVDARAMGTNNGSSWDNALVQLYDALDLADDGDEIRVAQGVYQPNFNEPGIESEYEATFRLTNGVTLMGGYAGVDASNPDDRDVLVHETILCGYLDVKALSDPNNFEYVTDLGGGVYQVVTLGESTDRGVSDNTVLEGVTITGGRADYGGAGISINGSNPRIVDCLFRHNYCKNAGAAMHNWDASPVVINCTFAWNYSEEDAGAIYNLNSNPTFEGCLFVNNQAESQGGAIINEAREKRNVCSPKLANCRFISNHAGNGGGAMASWGRDEADCRPRLTDCVFAENSTYGYGGAISSGGLCRDTLSNCTFRKNSAGYGGGAIDCSSNTRAKISRCVFEENDALFGGAILNQESSEAGFRDCIFLGNTATSGGAVDNEGISTPAFSNCLFQKNEALFGGAMYNEESDPTVVNCRFLQNSALDGGAVCNGYHSYVDFSYCVFWDNLAEDRGGAWFSEEAQSISLLQCMFAGNLAYAGGACYIGENVHSSMVNGVFTGNSAELGGALGCDGSQINLMNCSLHANTAVEGAALACDSFGKSSDVVVFNCILWNGGEEVWNNDRSSIEIKSSDVQGGWPNSDVKTTDPCFVDADGLDNQIGTEDDNLRLRHDSPLIDMGEHVYIDRNQGYSAIWYSTDHDGNPRRFYREVDLGAFEFNAIVVDSNEPSSQASSNDNLERNGSPDYPFDTIEMALEIATKGQTVLVLPGHYLSPDFETGAELRLNGTDVILTSLDPTDPDIAGRTILGGAVLFSGTETPACVLQGFTVQNAEGGIFGNHTQATIRHCNIVGNGPCGATVLKDCDGLIENCLIADNKTFFFCGAFPVVSGCQGLFRNCTITNNATGVSVGSATLENCIITHNGTTQLAVEAGQRATVRYCCIQDGAGAVAGEGEVIWGPGNITDDPAFVQLGQWIENSTLASGDYHLQSQGWRWSFDEGNWTVDEISSPCIDAGDPNHALGAELLHVPQDPNNEWGWNKAINMGVYGGTSQASLAPAESPSDNAESSLTPNPAIWAEGRQPKAVQVDPAMGDWGWGITMTAAEVTDSLGGEIDYLFDCMDNSLDSQWQQQRDYTVSVGHKTLVSDFVFRVKARNTNGDETAWSEWTRANSGS